jgi:hypothetical protein
MKDATLGTKQLLLMELFVFQTAPALQFAVVVI